jgi:UDP-N-acetylmuramyl pentapeptide phosphotransferase/UDP-N-acetylglucosamine-1-phosphate transferase
MIAILSALGFALALEAEEEFLYLSFGALVLCAGSLGWAEDSKGLSIGIRALCQLALGVCYGVALTWYFSTAWYLLIPIAIVIASYINFANFMDGINGISSSHGLVAGFAVCLIGRISGWEWSIVSGAIVAAAFVSFLPWNFNGKLFLGDVGSYTLGASVAGLSVALFLNGENLLVAISHMAIYSLDTTVTLLRRLLRGEKWYESHREHVYQQLAPRYLTHLQTAFLVAGFTSLVAFLAILGDREGGGFGGYMLFAISGLVALMYLWTPKLFEHVVRSGSDRG